MAAGVLAAVVGAALPGCRGDSGPGQAGPAAPRIAHVHGLGIDPADGNLYVATHTGLFALPDGGPARPVGTGQDTMGFTVVGPNHFVGSGHPGQDGARRGQPANLGVIETTDAGVTWRTVALGGKVDLHALATAQGVTYGWDAASRNLLASTDLATWETRSALPLFGLAANPADGGHLVAATPTGLRDSRDGGRTWAAVPSAPPLAVLSWDPTGPLWGADEPGRGFTSDDGGRTWRPAGALPGPPTALLAEGGRLHTAVAAVGRTGIHTSTDGGLTWTLRYREQP